MCWSLARFIVLAAWRWRRTLLQHHQKHRRCSQLLAAHVCAACAAKLAYMCTLSVDQSVFVQYHDRVLYENIVCHKQQPFSESTHLPYRIRTHTRRLMSPLLGLFNRKRNMSGARRPALVWRWLTRGVVSSHAHGFRNSYTATPPLPMTTVLDSDIST